MAKRKLRHVPGSPVGEQSPEQQQVDSRYLKSTSASTQQRDHINDITSYAVQDDEPIKRRQSEAATGSSPKERLLRRINVMKLMRTSNASAAELSSDFQKYGKQKPKVSAARIDRFHEDLVTKNLNPNFVSSDDILGKRPDTGHPSGLFSCTEIPVGFSSLKDEFACNFLKGLALPQDVSEKIAFNLLTAVAGLHKNASAQLELSPDTVLVGPNLQIKILGRSSAIEGLKNVDINASLRPQLTSHVGAIEAEQAPPDGSKGDMYSAGALLLMCTTGNAPSNLENNNQRPDLKEVADHRARDLLRWLLHGKSSRRPEAPKALRHPWLRHHQQRQQQIGITGPAALFSNTQQDHRSPVEILPGNPYGRLCQSMGGWASSSHPRREASSNYRGANQAYISDSNSSDDSVHHVPSSDHFPPMNHFSSNTHEDISKASGPPPPGMPGLPVHPLLPLLPIRAGAVSATSGAVNRGNDHSSSSREVEPSSSSSIRGSCATNSKTLGATTGRCDAQAKGPLQSHAILDVGLLPSSCESVSLPTKRSFSSSGGRGKPPLAFRKYANKYSLPRGAMATVTVAPPLTPRVRELDLVSEAADEDLAFPWIGTAVAAARGMASAATAIPITATIVTAAARLRSHWA